MASSQPVQPASEPIQPPSASSCALVKPTGNNLDMAWQWNSLRDINNKKAVTCDFCLKTTTGGITRAKRHQMRLRGDVNSCTKTPSNVRALLKEAYVKKKTEKDAYLTEIQEKDEEEEEVEEIHTILTGKRPASAATTSSAASSDLASTAKKGKNVKGPIDLLLFRNPEDTIKLGKNKRQTSINDVCKKEARARTVQYIERFLIRNSIPFNVVRSKSFKLMIEAVGNYGQHLKVPSYHVCRVPLLKKELDYTKDLMKNHELERENFGCTIMSDAWTDKKNRILINFLVNCPTGSMFVKSVDASSYMKTGEKLFELLDKFVEEVGESKVVQVVTDNGSNYVLAGKLLQAKRPHLFWTPCAAHCIDLMLEDIGKIARIKKTIQRGISLVGFIYNHSLALNTMRRFTNKTELVRDGVTRFATTFLTLQRLHNQKNNLRRMFTSDEWLKSKAAKESKGKRATNIVLMPTFWADVIYTLKAMGPLVQVLRLVDNEKKPAMGYIYEAMDRAKEAIQNAFQGKQEKYKEVFDIIDKRWECQLHHPLHAAGHYLNPQYFYGNPTLENDPEVMEGLYKCIERLSTNEEDEDKANNELPIYRRAGGLFGLKVAIRQRSSLAPAEWWKNYGSHTPYLQKVAIKVLSLTCSSSGCERNWSIFEHVPRLVRMHSNEMEDIQEAHAGQIVAVFGVDCASGDTFTDGSVRYTMTSMNVPEPVMSLAVHPVSKDSGGQFSKALNRFQKEDPTFRVGLDPESGQTIISGMGELHLDIYVERIRREYKVDASVGKPRVNFRETVTQRADFDYLHKKQTGGQGQYGRVIGYIEPLPAGSPTKFEFENMLVGQAIPSNFIPAIEKGFKEAANSGALIGHPVENLRVVLTDGAAHAVDSSELAFKLASIYAFRQCYAASRPVILEPVMLVELKVPTEFQGAVAGDINKRKGVIVGNDQEGDDSVITAHVPLNNMFGYSTALRSMTQGKGEFTMEYKEHSPVSHDVQTQLINTYKGNKDAE